MSEPKESGRCEHGVLNYQDCFYCTPLPDKPPREWTLSIYRRTGSVIKVYRGDEMPVIAHDPDTDEYVRVIEHSAYVAVCVISEERLANLYRREEQINGLKQELAAAKEEIARWKNGAAVEEIVKQSAGYLQQALKQERAKVAELTKERDAFKYAADQNCIAAEVYKKERNEALAEILNQVKQINEMSSERMELKFEVERLSALDYSKEDERRRDGLSEANALLTECERALEFYAGFKNDEPRRFWMAALSQKRAMAQKHKAVSGLPLVSGRLDEEILLALFLSVVLLL